MSLQNLKEKFLYDLLPEGVVELDERGLIAAVLGGIQDRLEDLRFYVKKYEIFFDTHGIEDVNSVVLVTFETGYGKTITRTLDPDDDTPASEGTELTAWAALQMGVDVTDISSCVYGTDLLRYVDINTLQYIAATVGAVLWSTEAQQGTETLNQQRILDSYFPRLKIKGTVQSFDALGRLLGFDDIRISPLWGRLSPRVPDDFGNPSNDSDFSLTPAYQPQQTIGIQYNPYDMRDGPFFSWSGTVVTDQSSTSFYSDVINNHQPWVKVSVVGAVSHPPVGSTLILAGGGPHAKASVTSGGLKFEALGEGSGFNGLQIDFATWNSGTDRLVSISDRLSTIKYRTSYFDIAATVTEERAIAQFGTVAARKNTDLSDNPSLTQDGAASPPYRPWYAGTATTPTAYYDYTYKVIEGVASVVAGDPRLQSTSAQPQFNISPMQNTVVQYVGAIEEVKPATRQPRRVNVGFLDKDQAGYAAYLESSVLQTAWTGTTAITGYADKHIPAPYTVAIEVSNGTTYDLTAEVEPTSNGTIVEFSDGVLLNGTYNIATHTYWFQPLDYLLGVTLTAYWSPTDTEVVRSYSGTDALEGYQRRPEDDGTLVTPYLCDTADEFPWRADLVNGGELVELRTHAPSTVEEFDVTAVDSTVAVKDQTGMAVNLYGLISTIQPIRLVQESKATDDTYTPGQIAICYEGVFKSLDSIPVSDFALPGNFTTALDTYFTDGANLYHTGLVRGVMVADPKAFFGPANRNGLVGWMPLNEHPDEGRVANDLSSTASDQTLTGFTLTGSFADRLWSDERGWYLNVSQGGTVSTSDFRDITDEYSLSLWIKPNGTVASNGTSPIFTHGPVKIDLPDQAEYLTLSVFNSAGTHYPVGHLPVYEGTFSNVFVTLSGSVVRSAVAPLGESLSLTSTDMTVAYDSFDDVGHTAVITYGSNRGYGIQDVRMWNEAKEEEEANKVHDYNPTPTICTYWPTNVSVVGSGDRYGLKKTPAGFVYPDKLPPAVRMNQLARITRYDDMGRYQGENRRKEVGLGGGTLLPQIFTLGQLFYTLTATGTTVVSGYNGQLPGYNPLWFSAGTASGTYINLPFSGSSAIGISETLVQISLLTGEADYWPHQQQSTNPCTDFAWVKADNGTVFEFTLRSVGTASAELVGTTVPTTGAEMVLASSGTVLSCNVYGTVYQKFDGSSLETPPLFMYLNSRVKDEIDDAYTTWTEKSDSSAFGNQQTPKVAALDENGILEFENTSILEPGYYRLTIESGNIGKVDDDFDGYSVEITLGDKLLITRLAVGETGSNFTTSDIIEFELTEEIAANWFLTISWLNSYSNLARGVARQLVIYGYTLEKIQSELYAITINTTGTGTEPLVTRLDTSVYSGNTPGGWLASINSYGSVVQWRHESVVFPKNDTLSAVVPLSDTLTSNTPERREDQIVIANTGSSILPDIETPPFPLFTTITVS